MKLHLGSGPQKLKGYIDCDIDESVSPNMIIDLEKPLPFNNNSVDEIYTRNTLEHIRNIIPLIKELHRICKPNAKIKIEVPFFSSFAYYGCIQHVTRFAPWSFNNSSFTGMFDIEFKIKYMVEKKWYPLELWRKFMNWFVNKYTYFYCRALANILPSSEIEYNFVVKKGVKNE